MNKTVKEIMINYLEFNDFDGLINSSNGCHCALDNLMNCKNCTGSCVGAYLHIFPKGIVWVSKHKLRLTAWREYKTNMR